jgi:hypothetical protein
VADAYAVHARISGDADCFLPIHDYCAAWLPECARSEFPYELVPLLSRRDRLTRAATRHFQEQRTTPRVRLQTYSRSEIRARIKEIRAERGERGP